MASDRLILLTGATGYIGGRLLIALEKQGEKIRCLARRPEFLRPKVGPSTEVVGGDVFDPPSLDRALAGVDTAYFLVHSLAGEGSYSEKDRVAAHNFGEAARRAGVRRIVFLGGLGAGKGLSTHLASRQEVGSILRDSGVPTIEFRASIVIGSGSLSFELVRGLVEKLPVMTTPKWVRILAQPIAIQDVIAYLVQALDVDVRESRVFEIGGGDRVSYGGIMAEYARQRGLRRLMIPVPFLTPHLSALWLALVTPLYARVGRALIEGVRNETVVNDPSALEVFSVRPVGISAAIASAMSFEDDQFARTHWSDALVSCSLDGHWKDRKLGERLIETVTLCVPSPPPAVFASVKCIGGDNGWYAYPILWELRGGLDKLLGGIGFRKGRRDPTCLLPGDRLDFWRVEAVEKDRLLRLAAEIKMPGRAWLQFELEPDGEGTRLTMSAILDPLGVLGRIYWFVVTPLHRLVFPSVLRSIGRSALSGAG